MVFDAALFGEDRPCLDLGIELPEILVGVALADERVERGEIQSEVKIVDESLLAVTYVHESSVQGRENLLDSAKIDITYREAVILG